MRKILAAIMVVLSLLVIGCGDDHRIIGKRTFIDEQGQTQYRIDCRVGYTKNSKGESVAEVDRRVASKKEYEQAKVGDPC